MITLLIIWLVCIIFNTTSLFIEVFTEVIDNLGRKATWDDVFDKFVEYMASNDTGPGIFGLGLVFAPIGQL